MYFQAEVSIKAINLLNFTVDGVWKNEDLYCFALNPLNEKCELQYFVKFLS